MFAALCLVAWISSLEARAAATPGSIIAWGGSVSGPIAPPDASNGQTVAIAAAAGYSHSMALISAGQVIAWGAKGQFFDVQQSANQTDWTLVAAVKGGTGQAGDCRPARRPAAVAWW